MDSEKIGKFIRELRKKNNLTQKDLAKKYNVTYQAVSKWERGINMPDISLIRQMSKDFNIGVEDILDGEIKEKKKEEKIEEKKENIKEDKDGVDKYKLVVKLVGMIALFLVVGLIITAFAVLKSNNKKTVILPNIEGKSQEEAGKELDKIGVYYTFESEPSNDYEEGVVVGYKAHKADSKVKQETNVVVQVSSGKSGFEIEDYTKRNVNVVKIELENKGIKVITTAKKISTDEEKYKDYDEGNIISQSKKAGSRIDKGGAIELVYATIITVYPDFLDGDWDKDKIQAFCDDNEITCDFEEVNSSKKSGTILAQGRKEGVEVKKGVTLKITIAKHTSSSNSNSNENSNSNTVEENEEEEEN